MTQHRNRDTGDPFPAGMMDALEEHVSSLAANVALDVSDATHVRLKAGTGNAQVILGIEGSWRRRTTDQIIAVPGGATGGYDLYAVASALDPAAEDAGTFDYTFTLQFGAPSGSGSQAIGRKLATVMWDNTAGAITDVIPAGGDFKGQSKGWAAIANLTTRKTFDADAVTLHELADVVGTLIEYLRARGLVIA